MASPNAHRPGIPRCEGCGKDIAPSWDFCGSCGQDNRAPEGRHDSFSPHTHQSAGGAYCVQCGTKAFVTPVSDIDSRFWTYILVPWRRVLIGLILALAGCIHVALGIRSMITRVGLAREESPAPTGWAAQVQGVLTIATFGCLFLFLGGYLLFLPWLRKKP